MKKILLVEDDNNLREIYGARLLAEGYDIVSAKDGEEALSMAVSEKPDLIISDIMMPKISGFDMLDILRATPQTKNTKVIMMTALSQAEDRERGERLGADRYLVKSQVTLEDVVKVVKEVLSGTAAPTSTATPGATATPDTTTTPADTVSPDPTTATPPAEPASTPTEDKPTVTQEPVTPPAEPASPAPEPTAKKVGLEPGSDADLESASRKPKVIAPINDPSMSGPDLNKLLEEEIAKENSTTAGGTIEPSSAPQPSATATDSIAADEAAAQSILNNSATSTADEKQVVADQIQDFVQKPPAESSSENPTTSDTPPTAPVA